MKGSEVFWTRFYYPPELAGITFKNGLRFRVFKVQGTQNSDAPYKPELLSPTPICETIAFNFPAGGYRSSSLFDTPTKAPYLEEEELVIRVVVTATSLNPKQHP